MNSDTRYTLLKLIPAKIRSGCSNTVQRLFRTCLKPVTLIILAILCAIALWYHLIPHTSLEVTLPTRLPVVAKTGQALCYLDLVYNKANAKFRLPDILADDVLEKSQGKNIFFHLTNCIMDGVIAVNSRQACAVESAARVNSHLNVFLAYAAPVGFLNKTELPLVDALLSYKNIFIRNLDIVNYAQETLAAEWIKEGQLAESKYIKEHTSDFLRLVSLYRFGGQFLDLDTVSIKNISLLGTNFVGAETNYYVANAVVNIDPRSVIGHKVVTECLKTFTGHYVPNEWGTNGPVLFTNFFQKLCHTTNTTYMTRDNCEGFNVFSNSSNQFYGISYALAKDAFNPEQEKVAEILKIAGNATLVHMSNAATSALKVDVETPVGYGVLAELYCPRVYMATGKNF